MQKLSGASFFKPFEAVAFLGGKDFLGQDVEISSKKTCFFETPGKSARSFAILAACGEAILLNDDMFQKDVCLKRRIREAFKTGDFSGTWDDPSFKFSDLELLSERCEVESFRV